MKTLKKFYKNQAFFPSWIGIFINPFYIARSGLQRAIAEFSPKLRGKLLDVGCGVKPYERLFKVDSYVGLDIDSENTRKNNVADYLYDGNKFPFEKNVFDSVLCNQVLEHVFNPDEFLSEISCVLKLNGKLLLTIPFVWDEHDQPYDYARYSSFGLKALLEKNGFKILEYKKIGADASTIFQLVNAYLYKVTLKLPLVLRIMTIVMCMSVFNIFGIVSKYLLPKNEDLYLDHIVLAEKIH